MIKFKFILKIQGIYIDKPVSFVKVSDRFKNIILSPNDEGNIELIVTKQERIKFDLALSEAVIQANEFVDRLSLIHNITSMGYIGYSGDDDILVHAEFEHGKSSTYVKILDSPEKFYMLDDIQNLINGKSNSSVLRIYRTALSISDSISQYLLLYGILLIFKKENQKDVDHYIKNEIPDILMVRGNRGMFETIISRIRNSIAHPTENLDVAELGTQAKNYTSELKSLVLKLLRANMI